MTVFDYLVLFVLICSIVISMMRGLVKEILSLVGWVTAFLVANLYCDALAQWLPEAVPGHSGRLIVAFLALFIGVKLLMLLLTMAVDAVVKASGLMLVDRGLGGLFGLARGIVIVLAAVLVCGTTSMPRQSFWTEAVFSPLAETAARTLLPYLPGNLARHVTF